MKICLRILGIIVLVTMIGFLVITCDFFKERDCSHCNGSGKACGITYDSSCSNCQVSYPDCWVCSGSGKVPDW